MTLWLSVLIFIASCAGLYFAGELVVESLTRTAKFLGWREFVVAFIVIAFAASLPNLFVGITSAINKIPELSFGDIVGGNVIDLTLAVALAALVAKSLPADSRTVQTTSLFTTTIAILPLLLILDGRLGRGDGVVLILTFGFYLWWLFSKQERFTKVYNKNKTPLSKRLPTLLKDIGKIILGIIILILAAKGIVESASFFAETFNLSLSLIGILIVSLGNALPETYFAIASARKGQTWMILGDLMGSVITPATLVLGIVALICPIQIPDFSPFAIARLFLIISALFFFIFLRTGRKITRREAIFLLIIYIVFVLVEIFTS
ncbi:MAG TPA: sodium:calcium antiporter [Candidatus Pacearchaeota archaeon]|nr:sodium:calcium antiporter [Candidatus Pacearchaeota archaeon]HPO75211.1 sodium:calcium antiporter [Candidatus Pacearchaeota archaeon]